MPPRSSISNPKIELIPQRVSLVDQAAIALRTRIERGDFGDVLPGEHALCSELQVGRRPLRMAIEILEENGYLIAGGQGRKRRIVPDHLELATKKRRISVILHQPFEDLPSRDQTLFRKLTERFENSEWQFRFQVLRVGTPKATAVRLKEFLAEDLAHLYIAFEAHTWMLEFLHDLTIPVIGLKSRHCIEAPRVAYDLNGALRHAVNTLLRAGRRSIVVPPVHEPAPHAEAVLQKLYAEWNLPFDTATAMPIFDGTRDGLVKLSEKLFRRPIPPDGMVLYDPLHLVTVQGWLASKGLQLISDFSVIVINHDPLIDSVYPSVPYYAAPVGPVVTAMHRIIDSFLKTGYMAASDHLVSMKFRTG